MRRLPLIALIASLPFLSGCLSSLTLDKVNETTTTTLPDKLFRVENAAVITNNQLYILCEGSLANPKRANKAIATNRFELTYPLQRIQVTTGHYTSTNQFSYGVLMVPRSAIHTASSTNHISASVSKTIFVAATVTVPDGSNIWDYAGNYRSLSPMAPTIYPINDLRSTYHYDWPPPMVFIYVDPAAKQDFTVIQIEQVKVDSGRNYGYYFLLPLTVPLDIATLPIQIPFILLLMHSINC